MSELKRYWVVIHYETEIEAETEWEACHEIRLGNTIVENATLIAKELPTQSSGFKEGVHPLRCKLPTASKSEAIQTRTRLRGF